jgi:DNA-binding transcriptional MerR regulator
MAVLRIGAFARRASVSIKTLRFYDRAGVFRPIYVDPRSGYRYYETDQLAMLRELRRLRELGCSVANLRTWIEGHGDSDCRTALLLHLRKTICHRLDEDLQSLRAIDHWIQQMASSEVASCHGTPTERSIPDIPAYTLRDRVGMANTVVYKMFEAAERAVARQQARAARQPFLLLHGEDYCDRHADVEVCIPIHSAALAAVGGSVVEGARRAACLGFSGSYNRAPPVFRAIESWLRLSGACTAGPLREAYIRFGADQRGYQLPKRFIASTVAEYRTELQMPFAQA